MAEVSQLEVPAYQGFIVLKPHSLTGEAGRRKTNESPTTAGWTIGGRRQAR